MIFALLAACSVGTPPTVLDDFGPLPDFSLQDQDGRPFTAASMAGKVWVADFFFTSCPDVCPILSGHMAEAQAHYRDQDDVRFLSFSVDPVTDTPPVLLAYAQRMGALPGHWYFLTGPMDDVRRVVVDGFKQAIDAVPAKETSPATILHGSRFIVVDRVGHLRAFPDPKEPGMVTLYAQVDAVLAGR